MIEIFNCIQGSPEWYEARRGIPTASCFKDVLAKNRAGNGPGLTRATYMRRLAGEIITGEPAETFKSADMERGNATENDGRMAYAFAHNAELTQVGFVRRDILGSSIGCSPDSFIGDDGILEIKTQKAELLINTMATGAFPPEHVAQCQGALYVTNRKWIDLCIYWPKMPLFIKRANRDEKYIAELAQQLALFNTELAAMVAWVRAYGQRRAA